MNAVGWILFVACNIASAALGWRIRDFLAERAQFRAESQCGIRSTKDAP